ncbi:hypothetical protein FXO37_04254 [Capsicum annuum]|nr:hypothetical protein FXO37_04254 [Capsicum annuum]
MSSNFLMGDVSSTGSSWVESEANEEGHGTVRHTITRKLFDDLLYSSRKQECCAGTLSRTSLPRSWHLRDLVFEYELGDASMKKNLVNALVGTLTGSWKRKRAVKLVEDSELFQDGTIGESSSGGKLSTYNELCNLAKRDRAADL